MIRTIFARVALPLIIAVAAMSFPPPLAAQARDSVSVATGQAMGQATVQAADTVRVPKPAPNTSALSLLTMLGGVCLIGAMRTVSADKDSAPAGQSVRVQVNNLAADLYYFLLNRPAWQVAAAAVAPPVLAIGSNTAKVKTTATTQLVLNGVLVSLTATDDLWTLTGGNLAAGSVRRYLMLWDGSSATTVVSVLASDDRVIASYTNSAAALAACRFPSLPPAGTGIVGIVSIVNLTNAFVPGTTALTATGVTTTYRDGLDDSVFRSAQITP